MRDDSNWTGPDDKEQAVRDSIAKGSLSIKDKHTMGNQQVWHCKICLRNDWILYYYQLLKSAGVSPKELEKKPWESMDQLADRLHEMYHPIGILEHAKHKREQNAERQRRHRANLLKPKA